MAIVGSAWVVVKAITTGLRKDVQKGLDDAGKAADESGRKAGVAYGENLSSSAESELKRGLSKGLNSALDDVNRDADRRGTIIGRTIGGAIVKGLAGVLPAIAGLTTMSALVVGLPGLIGGLVGAVVALGAGLTALVGPLAVATAGLAALGGVGLIGFLGALAVVIPGIKSLSDKTAKLGENGIAAKNAFADFKTTFKGVIADINERTVFGPLSDLFSTLTDEALPALRGGLGQIGEAIGNVISTFNSLFESTRFLDNLEQVLGLGATAGNALGVGMANLLDAVISLLAAAGPLVDRFAQWFQGWTKGIATMAQAGLESGRLTTFLNRAGDVLAQLGRIAKDVFGILKSVFSAAGPLGQSLLNSFEQGAHGLNLFLKSAEGMNKLKDFFNDPQMRANMSAVWQLVKDLAGAILSLGNAKGIQQMAQGISAAVPALTAVIRSAIDAVGVFILAIGKGLASPAGVKGVQALQTGIENLGTAFSRIGPAMGPLLQIVGDLATNLANFLGPAIDAIVAVLPKLIDPLNRTGAALGGALLGAVRALAPLLPPLASIIASLAQGISGAFVTALGALARAVTPVLDAIAFLLNVLQPVLPLIITIGAAWKTWLILSSIGLLMQKMGGFMIFASQAAGPLSGVIGKVGAAMSGLGRALPILGIAFLAVVGLMQLISDKANALADALRKGGQAAADAATEFQNFQKANDFLNKGVTGTLSSLLGLGVAQTYVGGVVKQTSQTLHDQWVAMTPLEQATAKVSEWTATYRSRLAELGPTAAGTQIAIQRLTVWTGQQAVADLNAALANGDYSRAVNLVTDALWAKIDAEIASTSATAAAEQSAIGAARAAEQLAAARKSGDPLAVRDAELQLTQATERSVAAAQAAAKAYADQAVASGEVKSIGEGVSKSLHDQVAALDVLIATTKGPAQAELIALRDRLTSLDGYVARPDVEVVLDAAKQSVDDFVRTLSGFNGTVTDVEIRAQTDKATSAVGDFLTQLLTVDGVAPSATVQLKIDDAETAIGQIFQGLNSIDGTTSEARVRLEVNEARQNMEDILRGLFSLDGSLSTAQVDALVDGAMGNLDKIMARLLALNGVTVLPLVLVHTEAAQAQVAGILGKLKAVAGTVTQAKIDANTTAALPKIADIFNRLGQITSATPTAEVKAVVDQAESALADVLFSILGVDRATASPEVIAQVEGALGPINDVIVKMLEANGVKAIPQVLLDDQASGPLGDILTQIFPELDRTSAEPQVNIPGLPQVNSDLRGTQGTLNIMGGAKVQPSVSLNTNGFVGAAGQVTGSLGIINHTIAQPGVILQGQKQFQGAVAAGIGSLHTFSGAKATPIASLTVAPFNAALAISRVGLSTFGKAVATPTININISAFGAGSKVVTGVLGVLGRSVATPRILINFSVFSTGAKIVTNVLGVLGRTVVVPTVRVNDQASGTLASIQSRLNAIVSKTITVTTVNRTVTAVAASGGLIKQDQFTTVGEEGRELVFLSQGSYVATYQKATKILAAASMQAAGLQATGTPGGTVAVQTVAATGGGVVIPINVHPSAGMNELELARKTGREFAFQYRRL